MESNTFSWERVRALLVRYWEEQRGKLLVVMMAAAALMFFGFSTAGKHSLMVPALFSLLGFISKLGFLICMLYHVHLGFSILKRRQYNSYFLMVPATNGEKFLFLILSSIVVPAIFYIILFVSFAAIFQSLFRIEYVTFVEYVFSYSHNFDFGSWNQMLIFYGWLTALILGQFLFNKNATVKTLLILLFGAGVFTGLEQLVLYAIFHPSDFSFRTDLLGGLWQSKARLNTIYQIDDGLFGGYPTIFRIVIFCMITLLGYVCYLKFTEKEVKV